MPGIARVGVDVAGGVQLGMQGANFRVNGKPVVLKGDAVAPHPIGPPHDAAPFMAVGSPTFRVNSIPVCRQGHPANCGHPTTGLGTFNIP